MTLLPDLEIGLHRQDENNYTVEMRFKRPDDAAQREPVRGLARFDLNALRQHALDRAAYGRALSASLFEDPPIREAFKFARSTAQTLEQALRLRLWIGSSAPELHGLRWETLQDPETGAWLLTDESVLFSRFLGSPDWHPVRLNPKSDLRALVAIANPSDLSEGKYQVRGHDLTPVNVSAELARARRGLGSLIVDELVSDPAAPGRVTIRALKDALRERRDILYLVCHGGILRKTPPGPYLWLEKDDGTADVVAGDVLVEHLRDLPPRERPMLVVLASCESATTAPGLDDDDPLLALGPRLASAGIPAVVAMQGSISMETVAEFMPVFFKQLSTHGQIDQAMSAARGAVRQRPDAWMPALFMRLQGGSVWFQPGFAGQQPEFEQWASLLSSLREEKCTPVLGPGLLESLIGSTRDLARRWAADAAIPPIVCNPESLAQVAQFLATTQSPHYPHSRLKRQIETEIRTRYREHLPESVRSADLAGLITAVGDYRRTHDDSDPFALLARLPIPVYVTTSPDTLLYEALRAVPDKDPVQASFVWKSYLRDLGTLPLLDPTDRYRPSVERPMVYHLMGHIAEPESWVISEDDHFDYLMQIDDDTETDIPSFVDRALSENALLFLGFQIDDWNFRVLFRSIMNEERRYRRRYHQSVAVQIDLAQNTLEPDRVRRYLERYFGDHVSIYWGSAEDFIRELARRWADEAGREW